MHKLKPAALLIIISCLVIMAGCKTTEPLKISDMHLPREFQLPDSISKNLNNSIIPWKQFFKDSVLVGLINTAFRQNFDLRTSNKEIAINKEFYKQSKAAFYPALNLNLFNIERDWSSRNSDHGSDSHFYKSKGETPPKNFFVHSSEFSTTAALDWEVDIWGKLRKEKRAARALYRQSFQTRKAIQTEVVATIAEDYFQLLMLDKQLQIARKNRRFRDSTLSMIQLLYKSGKTSALAVQQTKSQVLQAAALIPNLERERAIQENNLRLTTGELPGHIKRDTTLSALDSSYRVVKNIPLYLVQNRPDVQVARYELKAANANVGVTKVARYPDLTISLSGGVSSALGKNWFNIPGSLLGGIVGNLIAPLFNHRELTTNFEVAKLERDEADIGFQHTVYGVIVDVRNALVSIKKLKEQLKIAKEQQKVAQKAVKNSRMLFRSGFAKYLEVINAQADALDSELNLVQVKADFLTARVELYRALGGGWQVNGEKNSKNKISELIK
jgi:NodT family efflux transporter outer membrane factor (OMF) lipoprotein